MCLTEFKIGNEFFCGTNKWRCTDIGTRTVIAIELDNDKDTSWFIGPPYTVEEIVFDEDDIKGCTTTC